MCHTNESNFGLREDIPEISTASCLNTTGIPLPDWERILIDAAPVARPWDSGRFTFEKKLQDASRNQGSVKLMRDTASGGCFVAVKQMPLTWTQRDAASFTKAQPDDTEQPWLDIAIASFLNEKGCTFVCKLYGVFLDTSCLYVVSSLATEGDLFDWCGNVGERPGTARESLIQPVVKQLTSAVQALHEHGICHRDVSMENALLHRDDAGSLCVKLIDFGQASCSRNHRQDARGKYPYQAPEMHLGDGAYDGFLTDAFALGVVAFILAVDSYPWMSTAPGRCKNFEFASRISFSEWLWKRKVRGPSKKTFADALSKPFAKLLEGLLAFQPSRRFTLGERSWHYSATAPRESVWECAWMVRREDITALAPAGLEEEALRENVLRTIVHARAQHQAAVYDGAVIPKARSTDVGSDFYSFVCPPRMMSFAEDGPQFDPPPLFSGDP